MGVITYETAVGLWTFQNPTVTVTETPIISGFGNRVVSVRQAYTVRAIIVATTPAELQLKRSNAYKILEAAGGTFVWTEDGIEVARVARSEDTRWGPYPTNLVVNRNYNGKCLEIIWQIETERYAGDNDVINMLQGSPADLVYTVSSRLDRNQYTVRTITGLLSLRGGEQTFKDFSGADCYRDTVELFVPTTPHNWQRTQREYSQSEDKLKLSFVIVDEQRYAVLPYGVTAGEVSITASGRPGLVPGEAQGSYFHDLTLEGWFEAPSDLPDAPENAFVDLSSQIWNGVLTDISTEGSLTEGIVLHDISLTKDIYRPMLRFRVTWWIPSTIAYNNTKEEDKVRVCANYTMWLTHRADVWLEKYKSFSSTNPYPVYSINYGPYGTYTNLCGDKGICQIAPALTDIESFKNDDGTPATPTGTSTPTGTTTVLNTGNSGKKNTGYLKYHNSFKYKFDMGYRCLPSRKEESFGTIQQVRQPEIHLLITGDCVKSGAKPEIPSFPYPPLGELEGTNETTSCIPLNMEIVADNPGSGDLFSLGWNYVLRVIPGGDLQPESAPTSYLLSSIKMATIPDTLYNNKDMLVGDGNYSAVPVSLPEIDKWLK